MLRTATPATVRNVGRECRLRLLNSNSGAMASRRCKACAFCLAEKPRRSGSEISGREAKSLDWFGFERRAKAVQSDPDSNGCLRNFSCASTGKDDRAYSRAGLPGLHNALLSRVWMRLALANLRMCRFDHPDSRTTWSIVNQLFGIVGPILWLADLLFKSRKLDVYQPSPAK